MAENNHLVDLFLQSYAVSLTSVSRSSIIPG